MVSKASQNSLRELNIFQSTVMYGLDLYGTAEKAMIYCFGVRNLADVCSSALRDSSQVTECQDIASSLTSYVLSQMDAKIQKLCVTSSLSSVDSDELFNDVVLFWELYIARGLPNLFNEEFLHKFDVAMDTLEKYFSKNEKFVHQLPVALRRHISGGSPVPHTESAALPLFARDSFFGVKDVQLVEKSPEIIINFQTMLSRLDSNSYDFESVTAFVNTPVDAEFRLTSEQSRAASNRIATLWHDRIAFVDLRVRDSFLAMVEKFLLLSSASDRTYFCEQIFVYSSSGEPLHLCDHRDKIKNFEKDMISSINNLGDHNDLQNNPTKFHALRVKLFWAVILAPFESTVRLLKQGIENKVLVPGIFKILQEVSPVLSQQVPFLDDKHSTLLICALRQTYCSLAKRLEVPEIQDTFAYLVSCLARCKRMVIKNKNEEGKIISETYGAVIEDPLINVGELFALFISPRLISKGKYEQNIMLKVLMRILQNRGARTSLIPWNCEVGAKCIDDYEVPAVDLILLVHRLLRTYERQDGQMSDLCRTLLKCFADKLRDDNIIFPARIASFVMSVLSKDPWWLRYSIVSWFYVSLGSPMQQIPSGIYNAFDLNEKEKVQEIVVDFDTSPVACLLTSLFELALFDVNLAMDLLNRGLHLLPDKTLLSEQIALALVDACGRAFRAHKVSNLDKLLEKLLELLDPTIHISNFLITRTQLDALIDIRSISVMSLAAKIAFAKIDRTDNGSSSLYTSDSLDLSPNPLDIANEVLQAFCELSRSRIEKEIISLRRRFQSGRNMSTEEDCRRTRSDQSEYVMTQLFAIFKEAVQLGNLLGVNHSNTSLRVVTSQLTEYLKELIDMQSTIFLDNVKPSTVKRNTVYAYAAPPDSENRNTNDCKKSERDFCQPSNSSTCFAENTLFDQNRVDAALKTAVCSKSESDVSRATTSFVDPQTMHPSRRDKFIFERKRINESSMSNADRLSYDTADIRNTESNGLKKVNYRTVHDISDQISNLSFKSQIDKRFEAQNDQPVSTKQPSAFQDGKSSRKKKGGKKRH